MKYLDLTMSTPGENLALDEVLLNRCEEDQEAILRFWNPVEHFVVVGRGNVVEREVDVSMCRSSRVSILRRCSGGGAVVLGKGCLAYTVVLPLDSDSRLASVTGANQWILDQIVEGMKLAGFPTACRKGDSDLVVNETKVAGSAQRRVRRSVLIHGTILLDMNLKLIAKYLRHPSREPDYRQRRPHDEFLANLDISLEKMKTILLESFQADQPCSGPHIERIRKEVAEHILNRSLLTT